MKKLLFVISNGFEKAGRATRAFQFAQVACEKGHDVKVFLVDDAIHWAQFVMLQTELEFSSNYVSCQHEEESSWPRNENTIHLTRKYRS